MRIVAVGCLFAAWLTLGQAALGAPPSSPGDVVSPTDILAHFIPKDVLDSFNSVNAATRNVACRGHEFDRPDATLSALEPQMKLSGETSQMKDVDATVGKNLEDFQNAVSRIGTSAFVQGDDAQKTLVIKFLAKWATAGAYLQTIDCQKEACAPEWQTHRGTEKSQMKDSSIVLERVLPIAYMYYLTLRDYKPVELASEHKAIEAWLDAWERRLPKSPRSLNFKVEFGQGLGFQIWAVPVFDLVNKGPEAFQIRLEAVAKQLPSLILDDGSLKDRTTRGSRALWYHFAGLDETFVELEELKANGIDLYPALAPKLDKAVGIFLQAVSDLDAGKNGPKNLNSIYKWAKKDFNSAGDPRTQMFNSVEGEGWDEGSSWMYIYMHRFPDAQNAKHLRALVAGMKLTETDDAQSLNLGCIYRMADPQLLELEAAESQALDEPEELKVAAAFK